jgi:hypothetical protein
MLWWDVQGLPDDADESDLYLLFQGEGMQGAPQHPRASSCCQYCCCLLHALIPKTVRACPAEAAASLEPSIKNKTCSAITTATAGCVFFSCGCLLQFNLLLPVYAAYQNLSTIKVLRDRHTGSSKGMAFVVSTSLILTSIQHHQVKRPLYKSGCSKLGHY